MTQVLVLSHKVPWPLDDGHALRVFKLARHIADGDVCHLACLHRDADGLPALMAEDAFRSVTLLPPAPSRRHWRRHLRHQGNRHYHRLAYPEYFRQAVSTLQGVIDDHGIEVVVASLVVCEEFMRPLHGVGKVLDQYDCATLAMERDLATVRKNGLRERWRFARRLRETRVTESGLHARCDMITAISPADVARLQQLNPAGPPVVLLPNGVDTHLLDLPAISGRSVRGVAFWGNLTFPVNRLAIEFFFHEIWRPYLRSRGVRWAILGADEDGWLPALVGGEPLIETPGFVDDLFRYLADWPLMVNPMRNGTGLKNKVLEAMAAGKAVVSTSLGVDAFPFVDGEHGVIVDEPAAFADAVLMLLDDESRREPLVHGARRLVRDRYAWEAVGASWSSLLAKLGGVQRR